MGAELDTELVMYECCYDYAINPARTLRRQWLPWFQRNQVAGLYDFWVEVVMRVWCVRVSVCAAVAVLSVCVCCVLFVLNIYFTTIKLQNSFVHS